MRLVSLHTNHNQRRPRGLQTPPSVLQTLRSSLSRGSGHLAPSFIFLSVLPPQRCTGLICTHIKHCIGILFFLVRAILLSNLAATERQDVFSAYQSHQMKEEWSFASPQVKSGASLFMQEYINICVYVYDKK